MKLLLVLIVVLTITGCSFGMTKEECQVLDWRAMGYEDGLQGWTEARMSKHRKECAKHGVGLDLDAYRSGWAEGMVRYCQPGNGYHQGLMGQEYMGVCASPLEPSFLDAYGKGRALYSAQEEVKRVTRELRYQRKKMDIIEEDIRDTGIELVSSGISTERRVVLLDEIRELEQNRINIRDQIYLLEAELEDRKHQLSVLRQEREY